MSLVVKQTVSYGAFGRDHNSLSSWIASLTNANYAPGSIAIAELYNDADFDEAGLNVTAESNIDGVIITAADGQWHEGDPTTGVVFKPSGPFGGSILTMGPGCPYLLERIRFDAGSNCTASFAGLVRQNTAIASTSLTQTQWMDRLIITGGTSANAARALRGIDAGGRPLTVSNSLVYNLISNGAASSSPAWGIGNDDKLCCFNCTVDNVDWQNGSSINYGIGYQAGATTAFFKGCISSRISGAGSQAINSVANIDNCATDDATGDIPSVTIGDEFTDHLNGDYTLKAGAASAGSADEIDPHPLYIRRDLTGQVRAAGAWDVGALNNLAGYVSAGGGGGSTLIVVDD